MHQINLGGEDYERSCENCDQIFRPTTEPRLIFAFLTLLFFLRLSFKAVSSSLTGTSPHQRQPSWLLTKILLQHSSVSKIHPPSVDKWFWLAGHIWREQINMSSLIGLVCRLAALVNAHQSSERFDFFNWAWCVTSGDRKNPSKGDVTGGNLRHRRKRTEVTWPNPVPDLNQDRSLIVF